MGKRGGNTSVADSTGSADGAAAADTAAADVAPGDTLADTEPPDTLADLADAVSAADAQPDTPPVEVAPADNTAPTVEFKNLFNGTKVAGSFVVEVDAKDDTAVASVQFLLNGTPQETVASKPFTWTWDTTAFAAGNWFVSAIAKDAAGNASEPVVVEVIVANKAATCGEAPKVKLVYPTDKAVVCGDLSVETAVSGPCGVSKVEFYVNDKKIGEATEKPYKTPWKTSSLKDGPHLLKAVATDAAKQQGQQTIAVQVNNKQAQCVNPPTVFLSKPGDDAYVFGKVAIEAESAAGGEVATIVEVLFSVDGSSVGKASVSPWKTEWDSDSKAEGPHTLKAIAKDNFDKLGVHQITVNVDRTDPTVNFVSPDDAANVNGDATPVTVAAEAADNLNLASVAFSAGGKSLGTVKSKPYQVTWATGGTPSGQVTLTALATDAAGHSKSTTRTVLLDRDPTVQWTSGFDDSKPLSGIVLVAYLVKDDLGIGPAPVLTIDGVVVPSTNDKVFSPVGEYSYQWDTAKSAYGKHELLASVVDTGGHKATTALTVTVDQPLLVKLGLCSPTWQDCAAPSSGPKKEYTGKLYLQADATDDNAKATQMELQVDGKTVETIKAAPWQFTWDSAGVKDGAHDLALKVTTDLPQTKSVAMGLVVNNCDLDKDGHLANGGACGGDDCNDLAPKVYGGAVDLAGNATDENCDGLDGVDADGDKVASLASGGKDCNDLEKGTNPGAVDIVGDSKDNNCDGVDGVDQDGDGYANGLSGGKDCNDGDKAVNPSAGDFAGAACLAVKAGALAAVAGSQSVGSFAALAALPAGGLATAYYQTASSGGTAIDVPGGPNMLGFAQFGSGAWAMSTVDSGTSVGQHVSMAVGATSSPGFAIAYYDASNYKLKVATSVGGTSWSFASPDAVGSLVGQYTSIAYDVGNKLHVSYYDFGNYRLKYATNASGGWLAENVDPATNVGEYTSLKVDGKGAVHIAYYDAGKKALRYAVGNTGKWTIETVDAAGDAGKYASLVLDDNGNPRVAYYTASTKDLRYASKTGGKWAVETAFSTGSVGKFVALGWAKGGWGAVVAYLDEGQGQTMVGWRSGSGWTAVAIDAKVAAGAIALAVKPDNSVAVAYYDSVAQNLKLVDVGCGKLGVGGVDENCDGVDGVDNDGDKVASLVSGGKDCDDGNKAAYPCADELASEATDTNCDGKLAPSCDDCSACSMDALTSGKCVHTAVSEGAGCDDGNACTVGEVCTKAACGGSQAKSCDDANLCTADACDPGVGCSNLAVGEGGACELDGTKCTPDVCKSGKCAAGAAVVCDDKNSCTADSCDAKTGSCVNAKATDGAGCEDGDACTSGDVCAGGSCKGVAKVCGSTEVCKGGQCVAGVPEGMALIPAGSFKMGCVAGDSNCNSSEKPQHTVTLSAYYIDKTEVTVAAYKKCVDAGKCGAPSCTSSYKTYGVSGKEQHPVNCVNWTQADAYCKWTDAKGRLPTEAEWEKASRGGLEGKIYPWGDQSPTCTPGQPNTVVWYDNGGYGCGKDSTWAVGAGSAPNGYGLYDMSGNVWEWVNDWYGSSYYGTSAATDPQGPGSGSYRVYRGGGFYDIGAYYLRSSRRFDDDPSDAYGDLGFRCSRSYP